MSLWWNCTFSMIGPEAEIKRFHDGLPGLEQAPEDDPLWHHATVTVRHIGFLCVKASRNHGGMTPEQMVHEFPSLSFVGTMSTDNSDRWWTFEGHGGETTWKEFTLEVPEYDPECDPDEYNPDELLMPASD
jgi:hypothetical protein